MADFAIIQTGGKQYKVQVGDLVELELLSKFTEETPQTEEVIRFETLLISKDGVVTIGAPLLDTTVEGTLVNHVKGTKLHIRTFKAKSRHRRHIGHRQKYSVVKIKSI